MDSHIMKMETLKELYKTGRGPSSSHTIGPERACIAFKERNPDADEFKAVLYGSLAKTGKGHGTDAVIIKTFAPHACSIELDVTCEDLPHPNTMDLFAIKDGAVFAKSRVMSVGGGNIEFEGEAVKAPVMVYPHSSFRDIADYCAEHGIELWQYAESFEPDDFWSHIRAVWHTMKECIERGLNDEGVLPGGLDVHKKAKHLFESVTPNENERTRENRKVCAYAFAVSEQNAMGETIVTSPTCGSAGVLPAVLYYYHEQMGITDSEIERALATAGIIGNLIKTNASISGAECGCQVEVGSACAMAAAALGQIMHLAIDKIEYAAEIAIEHHLGLTCDPICGLVQIPCIERNAVAAMRAINAVNLAGLLYDTRKISFDRVVQTMKETGLDMPGAYKETSEAGLAKINLQSRS